MRCLVIKTHYKVWASLANSTDDITVGDGRFYAWAYAHLKLCGHLRVLLPAHGTRRRRKSLKTEIGISPLYLFFPFIVTFSTSSYRQGVLAYSVQIVSTFVVVCFSFVFLALTELLRDYLTELMCHCPMVIPRLPFIQGIGVYTTRR